MSKSGFTLIHMGKCVCATHSDSPEVGSIIQTSDHGRVQAQVVVLAEVPVQLQLPCDTQTKPCGCYLNFVCWKQFGSKINEALFT